MKISNINIDKEYYHHYLIALAIKPIICQDSGKIFLKYRPIHFTNDDIHKVKNVVIRTTDELFKQSYEDACSNEGVSALMNTISMWKVSCRVNDCTSHHIKSKEKIDEDDFELMAELMNTDKDLKQKIMAARI